MSDLVGKPEDRFSRVAAHIVVAKKIEELRCYAAHTELDLIMTRVYTQVEDFDNFLEIDSFAIVSCFAKRSEIRITSKFLVHLYFTCKKHVLVCLSNPRVV